MIKFLLTIIVLIMHNSSFANGQISNLIAPVSYFVDHVQQLTLLKSDLVRYRQASIVGTSGIGKTQAARMYSYENKDNYDLIWFIDSNLDINEEFQKLAKSINLSFKTNVISEDIKLVKKNTMEYLASKDKWLLVFDNLKVKENQKIKEFINWEHNGNVIFVSQDKELLPNIVEITKFNKNDTIALVDNLLKNKDLKDIEFLNEEFKGYPILIVQGAQLLNQVKGLNKVEYKKKIHDSADKIKLNITLAMNELKPSAKQLLNKIALINNQAFSKQLLNIITDSNGTLGDDIYELSKFSLISNIDTNQENPIFEMHDVVAQKIQQVNGDSNNQNCLEEIITNLIKSMPKNVLKSHIFRTAKTIHENLEIILKFSEKYNANVFKVMSLNKMLQADYHNNGDHYNAEKKVKWFIDKEKDGKFKLWLMTDDEKALYALYLGGIGVYYRTILYDYNKSIKYFIEAQGILDNMKNYESWKCSITYHLAMSYIGLGELDQAKQNTKVIEEMFIQGIIDKNEIGMLYIVTAKLLYLQGYYNDSLKEVNEGVTVFIKNGLNNDNPMLTTPYILKVEILNSLGRYEEAYTQAQQLYEMHKSTKNESHEIFGRIYTQMAKSELGLRKIDAALEHTTEAIAIFLADERRNPKEADYSEDPDLAASYVVQGDILFAKDNLKQAIESYKKAQIIYFYLYRDRSKNVAHVSYLYKQGAKAACKAKDLYNYKTFGKPQVKEFGIDHPNTIAMFEYCKQHDMDLWAKEN